VAQFHIINSDKKAVESYKVGRVTIATIQIEIYRTLGVKLDHLTTYAFEFLFMNGHLQHFFLSLLWLFLFFFYTNLTSLLYTY
jgi:hypothetical protein